MIDWKISAGAILGILFSVLLAHLLSKRREAEKDLKAKILSFKEFFIPLLKELESPNSNPATLVTQYYPEQDEAVRKLFFHLPNSKKKQFQRYWSSYTELYEEKKSLGFAALIATEVDDLSKANSGIPCCPLLLTLFSTPWTGDKMR